MANWSFTSKRLRNLLCHMMPQHCPWLSALEFCHFILWYFCSVIQWAMEHCRFLSKSLVYFSMTVWYLTALEALPGSWWTQRTEEEQKRVDWHSTRQRLVFKAKAATRFSEPGKGGRDGDCLGAAWESTWESSCEQTWEKKQKSWLCLVTVSLEAGRSVDDASGLGKVEEPSCRREMHVPGLLIKGC